MRQPSYSKNTGRGEGLPRRTCGNVCARNAAASLVMLQCKPRSPSGQRDRRQCGRSFLSIFPCPLVPITSASILSRTPPVHTTTALFFSHTISRRQNYASPLPSTSCAVGNRTERDSDSLAAVTTATLMTPPWPACLPYHLSHNDGTRKYGPPLSSQFCCLPIAQTTATRFPIRVSRLIAVSNRPIAVNR